MQSKIKKTARRYIKSIDLSAVRQSLEFTIAACVLEAVGLSMEDFSRYEIRGLRCRTTLDRIKLFSLYDLAQSHKYEIIKKRSNEPPRKVIITTIDSDCVLRRIPGEEKNYALFREYEDELAKQAVAKKQS